MARILIIDDEEMVRLSLDMIFRSKGWEIEMAEGGMEGLARARENPPDLIFCDLNMRGLSGMEILAKIRRDPVLRSVPVVLITGDMGVEREAIEEGAQAVLLKPFGLEELLRVVEVHLRCKDGPGVREEWLRESI